MSSSHIAPRGGGRSAPPNAQLVVLAGAESGRRFIVKDRVVIGRSEAMVLLLDDEVSRQHAEIFWGGSLGYLIRDLGSRNGTQVNGEPVTECQLNYGDEIAIGGVQLAFREHDPLEDDLLDRQQLETLGRLGAGVAHDLNNLIGAVLGNVEYLQSHMKDVNQLDPVTTECVSDILEALRRATALTPRLMQVAHRERARHARVSLSDLCSEIIKLMRRTFERSMVIKAEVDPELLVMGDGAALHQVVMNLCLNARDAMRPEGGTLLLSASLLEPDDAMGDPQFADRPGVLVTVADSGCGMDAHTMACVFEPFFTTKGKGAGYGIGLSTTRNLVTQHGGRIEVHSDLGDGSAFRVFLPAAPPAPDERREATTPRLAPEAFSKARQRRGTILVVDDEDMIHRMLSRTLGRAGYDVMSAHDGLEGLEVFGRAEPKPDLVLLDMDMPKAGGELTQKLLRQRDPNVRILVLTGHGDISRERTLLADGALGVLHKPLHVESLLAEIARALRSSPRVPSAEDTGEFRL